MKFPTLLIAGGIVFGSLPALPAMAQDAVGGKSAGDILVRLRGIIVSPDESSKITVIGGKAKASTEVVPEIDFTYFFTDNIAAELIAATTDHKVTAKATAAGDVALGDVQLLPPTLLVQYHFAPKSSFSPYVGAGINLTLLFDSDDPNDIVTATNFGESVGPALQAGADLWISENMFLNFDVKKIWLHTKVKLQTVVGPVKASVNLDPWIFGVGIGYKF